MSSGVAEKRAAGRLTCEGRKIQENIDLCGKDRNELLPAKRL